MRDDPIFLDFEATSFHGTPIEVAWGAPGGIIESSLIRPAPSWRDWSKAAEAVHGITREMLAADGRPVREVAARMNEALAGRTVYTDAPEFDERWCRHLYEAASLEMEFSFGQAHAIIPDVPGQMPELFAEARRLAGPPHRAAADVRFLVELWRLATEEARRQ